MAPGVVMILGGVWIICQIAKGGLAGKLGL